jgi:hypothetical protein
MNASADLGLHITAVDGLSQEISNNVNTRTHIPREI